jgi:hypothetical protein
MRNGVILIGNSIFFIFNIILFYIKISLSIKILFLHLYQQKIISNCKKLFHEKSIKNIVSNIIHF